MDFFPGISLACFPRKTTRKNLRENPPENPPRKPNTKSTTDLRVGVSLSTREAPLELIVEEFLETSACHNCPTRIQVAATGCLIELCGGGPVFGAKTIHHQRMPGGGWKRGERKTSRRTPLPKTGLGPPSFGTLRCCCSVFPVQKSKTQHGRSSFGGVENLSGGCVVVRFPPRVRFAPPYHGPTSCKGMKLSPKKVPRETRFKLPIAASRIKQQEANKSSAQTAKPTDVCLPQPKKSHAMGRPTKNNEQKHHKQRAASSSLF